MLLHMTFHSVTKPLLFFCAGNVAAASGKRFAPQGHGRMMHVLPVSASMFLLATLAVTGIRLSACSRASSPSSARASRRKHDRSGHTVCRVRGRRSSAASSTIFRNWCSGPRRGVPRGDFSRWKTYPVIGLAAVVIVIGSLVAGSARRAGGRSCANSGGAAMMTPLRRYSPAAELLLFGGWQDRDNPGLR